MPTDEPIDQDRMTGEAPTLDSREGFVDVKTSRAEETHPSMPPTTMSPQLGLVSEFIGRIRNSLPEYFLATTFVGFVVMITFGDLALNFKNLGYYFVVVLSIFILYIFVRIIDRKYLNKKE